MTKAVHYLLMAGQTMKSVTSTSLFQLRTYPNKMKYACYLGIIACLSFLPSTVCAEKKDRQPATDAGLEIFDTHLQAFEAYSPAREKNIDFQVNPDSIARYKQLPAYRRLNYHTPDDEIDRVDWEKLINITKATYLGIKLLVNEK
jgi:hypothetical protein